MSNCNILQNLMDVVELKAKLTKELKESFEGAFEHKEVDDVCDCWKTYSSLMSVTNFVSFV